MICLHRNKQGTQILLDYCAGTLDADRTGALEKHAKECEDCRDLIASQKNLWKLLDRLPAPELSEDFDARLYARIAKEPSKPVWRAWMSNFSLLLAGSKWKPIFVGAAAVAVLAFGLTFYIPALHAPQTGNPTTAQVRPESVDVEQVEATLEDLEMLMTPPAAPLGAPAASRGKM